MNLGCFALKNKQLCDPLSTRFRELGFSCEDTCSCIDRLVGEKGSKKNTFELNESYFEPINLDAKVQRSVRAQERAGTTVLKLSSLEWLEKCWLLETTLEN